MRRFGSYAAEFIGTFFLVFFGCAAIILGETLPGYDDAFVPLVFGGTVAMMIYACGSISGAHFNPAVTLAFWSIKTFPAGKVVGYLLAQTGGALAASGLHALIFGTNHSFGATSMSVAWPIGLAIEALLGFVLAFVIVSVSTDSRASGESAGMAIGCTVAMASFSCGPLTGASMNPARSLAPAVFAGASEHWWAYLSAPTLGALAAAKVYRLIR